jgi:pyruvate-formate lyase
MERLRQEMSEYYDAYRLAKAESFPNLTLRRGILEAMDEFLASHPDCHPSLLKARLHEEMAERFEPVIFRHSPFFFEMGLRYAENWGTPNAGAERHVGAWMRDRRLQELRPVHPEYELIQLHQGYNADSPFHLWNIHEGFDCDHHCLGYTHLLEVGVNGILAEIEERQARPCTPHQAANLEAMARSCRAMLRVAERFGERARELLAEETDPHARACLTRIAETAGRIPAEPPRTFYEGLAMLWFLREVAATLEGVGISVVGHLDRLLIDLYRADLVAGRLTEAEARDLLARWMLPTDMKFHIEDNPWPETSTCMELGGCDADGKEVWNELTRVIIETHRDYGLFNPKLNCRFSTDSPAEYLDLISRTLLEGHNHFALLNDGVLIPALVRSGKTEREARLYVNGGCQETITEGVEHSAGAFFYFNLARTLDLCLQPAPQPREFNEEELRPLPETIEKPPSFEEFYAEYLAGVKRSLQVGAEWSLTLGREQWRIQPCPFFSTTLEGCIEKGLDYSQGGAKYNPSGIALVGMGTVVDSLMVVKKAVYEEGWLTLEELRKALTDNWEGHEELRARVRSLTRYGHGDPEVDELAARLVADLAAYVQTLPAERGGTFQGSFFVYYAFSSMGAHVCATPDGRGDGDLMTQGVAPDRVTAPASLSEVFHTLSRLDFLDYPGNAVLDVQLPMGPALPVETLSATIRTFAALGGPTLQLNCVSLEELLDACVHPDQHRDLTVRISGLSARFVCLTDAVQEEIIGRAMAAV